jgi:DNA-binding CsgD family transcriptional regulator
MARTPFRPIRGGIVVDDLGPRLGPQRTGRDELADRVARLTPRELEILREAALGRRNDDIARALGMSRHTVRTHVQNILTKLGVHSKLEAVLVAIRYGRVAPLAPSGRERGTGPPEP